MNKWKEEIGHMAMGNKWLAYNAVQSFNQHEQGKGDRSEEKSLLRALDGKLGFSDKALKMLTNSNVKKIIFVVVWVLSYWYLHFTKIFI